MNERTRSTFVGDRNLGRIKRPSMRLHSTRSSTSSKSRASDAGPGGLPCRASARRGEALGTSQSFVRDALRRSASEMARYGGYPLTRPTARLVTRQLQVATRSTRTGLLDARAVVTEYNWHAWPSRSPACAGSALNAVILFPHPLGVTCIRHMPVKAATQRGLVNVRRRRRSG
jgi:hypothetical protein